jgi:putative aldouronate transport system substrate-binding protein
MNRKKIIPLILALTVVSTVVGGCSKEKDVSSEGDSSKKAVNAPAYLNVTGFPIVKEPITLKAMVSVHSLQGDYSQIMVWKEYEKMTGIKIEWEQVPQANITEKRNLALASGEYPDMFYRARIPAKDVVKYGEDGVFIELNELINNYGPNMKKVMAEMPEVKKSMPAYNGKIYDLPSITEAESVLVGPKFYLNRVWLDKLGLKMPGTTDELYTVLKAFKEKDPNGNGAADEIPWSATALSYITDSLRGAYGLSNRGKQLPNIDMDESAGKLRHVPTSTRYKEMLQYMNKLYKEGLIDKEIFTANPAQLIAKGEQNAVGAFSFVNTSAIGGTHEKDFEGINTAIKGPHGDQLWPKGSRFSSRGAFTITNTNKYPEATMRWIDYFYGDEGIKLFYMGIEGVSYKKTADGKYEFLDEIVNNIPKGSNFDQVIAKYVPYGGGSNASIVKTEFFKGGETQPASIKATESVKKYTPKEIWGILSFTMEEIDRITSLENDINSYINQMTPQFIQGKATFDQWDSYVEQVKKMGLDEYMSIYQKAIDRYNKN